MDPRWLDWAKRLQSVAQNGLEYAESAFDVERYEQVRKVAAEMLAEGSGASIEVVEGLLGREEGYSTPKVDVRGIVFRDDTMLLVR